MYQIWRTRFGKLLCLLALCYFTISFMNLIGKHGVLDPLHLWLDHSAHVCQIPVLDPYDKSILPFISQSVPPLKCDKSREFFEFRDGRMYLIGEMTSNVDQIGKDCAYKCLRLNQRKNKAVYSNQLKFKFDRRFSARIPCEMMWIKCDSSNQKINGYDMLHLNIVPIRSKKVQKTVSNYNIVVILLDSISRSNSIRHLPLTREYLLRNVSAIELTQFMRVGENTYPNLVPFLTGHPVGYRGFPNLNGPFDDWPMLWKNAESLGYATLFSQDWQDSSIFSMDGKKGFRRKPTSHQPRAFWIELFASQQYKNGPYYCYGPRPLHGIQLDYFMDFTQKYKDVPKFSVVVIGKFSHSFLPATAGYADKDLETFFQSRFQNHLNDSFVFLFSDHGLRYAEMRQTFIGRYEVNMPLSFVLIPPSFAQEHPAKLLNLQKNAKTEVTSVYDLHKTIMDVLSNFSQPKTLHWMDKEKVGKSLFDKFPKNRTCAQAGIPNEFCVCQNDIELSIDEDWVISAAEQLVIYLNNLLKDYPQCAPLHLGSIRRVLARSQKSALHENSITRWFQRFKPGNHFNLITLSLSVNPSDALIEADLTYNSATKLFTPIGAISRINQYGNQSTCIHDFKLKLFCYCI